jgi:hypothetical protein
MKLFNILPFTFLLLVGCASQVKQPLSTVNDGDLKQRYAEEDREIASENAVRFQASQQAQTAELDQLRRENQSLRASNTNLMVLLELNDYVLSHKAELTQEFQKNANAAELFKAIGGSGKLEGYEVEDVCLCRGYVTINIAFVWSNPDSSGGVCRGQFYLDPFEGCVMRKAEMIGETLISAQEFASLSQDENTVHKEAERIPSKPESEEPFLSDETKGLLINAGVQITTQVLENAITEYFNHPGN